jgi:hypothetical protein
VDSYSWVLLGQPGRRPLVLEADAAELIQGIEQRRTQAGKPIDGR